MFQEQFICFSVRHQSFDCKEMGNYLTIDVFHNDQVSYLCMIKLSLKHYIHISIFMVSDIWRLEIMSGSLLFLHVNDKFQANHKFSINWEIMCNVLLSEAFCLKSI